MNQAEILNLFVVDVDAGMLFWKHPPKNHSRLKGKEAGCPRLNHAGKFYWMVKIGGRQFGRGHLIFLAHHGRMPKPQLDHENGNSLDDRIVNLRDATVFQNSWNHKRRKKKSHLPMGVRLNPASGRFSARIGYHNRQIHLGAFDTPEEAQAVYLAKRKELFGEFA